MSGTPIQQAKSSLPLTCLMERLGLGNQAKKSAQCPFHEDKRDSFSVWQTDGGWFWKCHAGCGKGASVGPLNNVHVCYNRMLSKYESAALHDFSISVFDHDQDG
jgi:hypothetical protein